MSHHEARRPEQMFPVDVEGAPKIVLGGREWAVPKLAIAQNRHVVPALWKVLPIVAQLDKLVEAGADGIRAVRDEAGLLQALSSIDEDRFEAAETAVFWSLKRAHPGLSREEFSNFPADLIELFLALPVIMRQCGFLRAKPPGEPSPPGEEQAIETSTGT